MRTPTMPRVQLVLAQMDEAYARLVGRLDGSTEEEFFLQPSPRLLDDLPGPEQPLDVLLRHA